MLKRLSAAPGLCPGRAILLLLVAYLSWGGVGDAYAADPEPFSRVEQGTSTATEETTQLPSLVVTEEQCRNAVAHQPSADVAYKPGVDAYGRRVTPADLGGGNQPLDLPKEFNIDIGIDIASRQGQAVSPRPFESNLPVGKVTVKGDRFFFNGKEFGDSEQRRLEAACRAFLKEKQTGR